MIEMETFSIETEKMINSDLKFIFWSHNMDLLGLLTKQLNNLEVYKNYIYIYFKLLLYYKKNYLFFLITQ